MFKITEICSSHYVASDGDNEIFISLVITEDTREDWWAIYSGDDCLSEDAEWFDNKQEAFDRLEDYFYEA